MNILRPIKQNVWRWTWYSEEKEMEFNGYMVKLPKSLILIDPPPGSDEIWGEIETVGKPATILLTNKDHERESDALRKRFGAKILIHQDEAELLKNKPDGTFGDEDTVADTLKVVRMKGLKSPAECAFFWPARKILFVGDAVAGHPEGKLSLVKKHQDNPEVPKALKALLDLDFDGLLVGDGEPFLNGGKNALTNFVEASV